MIPFWFLPRDGARHKVPPLVGRYVRPPVSPKSRRQAVETGETKSLT